MAQLTKSEVITTSINSAASGTGSAILRGVEVSLESEVGRAFIVDCTRYLENSLSGDDIKGKYELSDDAWERLSQNVALLDAVRAERERRVVNGTAAREAAQRHFAKAPEILNRILVSEEVAPRHRIEAARELRQAAGHDPDIPLAQKEKVTITINLGADQEVIEKFIDPRGPSLPDDGESS
jgi:hypothetical protein